MSLVKVWTEIDENGKCQSLPAKIVSKKGNVFKISYLSPSDERDSKHRRIYKYEDDVYEVTDESITEYLDSSSELDLGFQNIGDDKFVKYDYTSEDEDSDYVPDEEDDDEEDESLEDYSSDSQEEDDEDNYFSD